MEGQAEWEARLTDLQALPSTERQKELTRWLCARAVETGIKRHAGVITDLYTPTGKKQIVKGKDLTAVKWVVGTGGALTRVAGGEAILRGICGGAGKYLLPAPEAQILMDKDYRFSAPAPWRKPIPKMSGRPFGGGWKMVNRYLSCPLGNLASETQTQITNIAGRPYVHSQPSA